MADDLAALLQALDFSAATPVGHSTGGGVARYIGRLGTKSEKGGAYRGRASNDAPNSCQPRGASNGSLRQDPRVSPVTVRSTTWVSPLRFMAPTGPARRSRKTLSMNSGYGACRLARRTPTRASRRSPKSISPRTSKGSTSQQLVMRGEDDHIAPVDGFGKEVGKAHPGRKGNLISRRAARPRGDAPGSGQRRSAGLPRELAFRTRE